MKGRIAITICLILMIGLVEERLVGAQDIERLKFGVVRITATEGNKTKVGTGFVVKLDAEIVYIVTAAHVVSGDPQPRVQFFSRQEVQVRAHVKHAEGGDEETGMALLTVRGNDNIPTGLAVLPLATTIRVSGGEDILVIGHPRGAGDWVVLKGNIASRQGRYLTVDANIDEGNSGGPIIHSGQVVGLIGGAQRYGKGVTFGTLREYLEGHGVFQEGGPSIQPTQPASKAPSEITGKDGAPMVLIPAGEFWMGSPDGEGIKHEHPRHQVMLDAFYMDKFEATTGRFVGFAQETNRSKSARVSSEYRFLPVTQVDWHDAKAYCEWAGKRLPTEAEWEKAARGTDGRTYPWGNEPPTARLANFGQEITTNKPRGEYFAPVDSYEAGKSPYGLHHMAGNVWEWVSDWYDENYYSKSPERNPKGPSTGETRVLRGGSWGDEPVSMRSALRGGLVPSKRNYDLGFRCAQDVPK